ncbi:hypothetical protein [Rhizobium leguminosarum]|uniref:hypothetical protein n=1 Tax=Rhizobium leguminosarum TaxID=384 RepID=UPI001C97D682|nr:hypothetical protein [Rhizobium leguminosarum]MBY5346046.1 hypothetical protein [Rhizobium leguminosarum]
MTIAAPPLEGFIAVVQHRPDVARRLESALCNAGATVFTASTAPETIEIMNRYQEQFVMVTAQFSAGAAP